MESSRGALDPEMAFIFEGIPPDKIRPDIRCFPGQKIPSRSDLYRDRDSMESPCLDPFRQD
jgi:hypothetical protein